MWWKWKKAWFRGLGTILNQRMQTGEVKQLDILRKIYEAGVVGAGGAGFPAHRKFGAKVEYLIVNGAECEPLLQTDQYIMRTNAKEILEAIRQIRDIIEANHIVIALKSKYAKEIDSIKRAMNEKDFAAEIFCFDSVYPAGDEQVLVYEVTGRTVPPGRIPLDVGVVVSNVTTIFNIFEAINDRPVTFRYLTVAGEVNNSSIVKVPIGTSVQECIEAAGGTDLKAFRVIMGGPMMGKILGPFQMRNRVVTKTDGGIIVIPDEHHLSQRNSLSIEHMLNQAKSACIQCSYCTDMCPRYLIGHRLRPHRIMRASASGEVNTDIYNEALLCSECGLCELFACPMGLSPRKINIYHKNEIRRRGIKMDIPEDINPAQGVMRDYRQIPVSRLSSRLDIKRYDRHVSEYVIELKPRKVRIPLKQHIGAPAVPVVAVGEYVNEGQLIGTIDYNELGANVHASFSGRVMDISDSIVIEGCSGEVK